MEINPNAFAIELNKIMNAKIGHKYLIMKLNIFLRLNEFPSCVISASIFSKPTTLETKIQMAIAAIVIMTEFVKKSKKSKNCIPMIVTFDNGP